MRLDLVLDRSSIFSEQTSSHTFSPLWGTPSELSPSGLSDFSINDNQRRSSGEYRGGLGDVGFHLEANHG